jgi:hypothetical protein
MTFGGGVLYKKSTSRREFVPARTFCIYCPISVKFGTRNLRILLLGICEVREYGHRMRLAFRRGVSGISFAPGP